MKHQVFDSFDPIFIISFLSAFKLAHDTNGVHKGTALWPCHFFIRRSAADALKIGVALRSKSHKHQKEGTVTSYCKAVNCLLETYGTKRVIAETDADMGHFTQPSNK